MNNMENLMVGPGDAAILFYSDGGIQALIPKPREGTEDDEPCYTVRMAYAFSVIAASPVLFAIVEEMARHAVNEEGYADEPEEVAK